MRSQVSTHSWLRRSTMSLTVSTAPHGKEPSCRNPWSRCCNCAKAVRPIACHIVGPLSIEDESVSSIKDQVGLPCPLCMSLSSNLLCPRKCHSILTTHVGSLPRPPALRDLLIRYERGESIDRAEF